MMGKVKKIIGQMQTRIMKHQNENGFETIYDFLNEELLELEQQINISLVKDIKTRKTNHMTALRTYKPGSEEAINLKARISECQQIISIINDLNLTDVSESYSDNEVKWMLFYGKKSDDSKRIDDFGRIDLAISLMFKNLEQTAIDKDAVEKIFWNRISLFLNSR